VSLAATPLERWPRPKGHRPKGGQDSNLRGLITSEAKDLSPSHQSPDENSVKARIPDSFTAPKSLRHDSNVRHLLYREASLPLDHGEMCRREDSNLGRTYASGPEPLPVDRLGTATRGTAVEMFAMQSR
jgi:hypothetical protein